MNEMIYQVVGERNETRNEAFARQNEAIFAETWNETGAMNE